MGCFVSCRRLSALALFAVVIAACGSPPPSAVDEEMLLVDLAACARGDAICEKFGSVAATPFLVEGNENVVLFAAPFCGSELCDPYSQDCCQASPTKCAPKGSCGAGAALVAPRPAGLSLPIKRASADARLAWIAIGVASGHPTRRLRISIDGQSDSVIEPSEGVARIELSGRDFQPAEGARLRITAESGVFGMAWIVGRWKR